MTTLLERPVEVHWHPPVHASGDQARLDRLLLESPSSLAGRFAAAPAPEALDLLEGDPVCRALLRGSQTVRRWAASPSSPWIGKSFELVGDERLLGHNRLRWLGGTRALAFTAAIGRSIHDGRPALVLRYDDPEVPSPGWTHAIHDELREIEPGLLAGPAAILLRRKRPLTLCWFAIDALADRPSSQGGARSFADA